MSAYVHMEDDDGCLICFEPLDRGDYMTASCRCVGQYHIQCLEMWRQRKNTCPTCDRALSPLMLEDEEAAIPVAHPVAAPEPRLAAAALEEEEQRGSAGGVLLFLFALVVVIVLTVVASYVEQQ